MSLAVNPHERRRAMTRSLWWPWKVCVFLLFATGLSYLDRQALSIAAPLIRGELKLDNAQLGILLSAFLYSYSFMHLVVGWILDHFPLRITYALFVICWSMSQALAGVARGFGSLFGARLLLGGFEAAAQPGAARIIAGLFPQKDRSMANGLMMSGGSLGALVAPVIMIWLANTVGWRAGFIVLGGAGLAWAGLWLLWFRPPATVLAGLKPKSGAVPAAEPWSEILRSAKFWSCIAGAAFGTPIIHITSAWIPTYFVQQWHRPVDAGLGAYLLIIYAGSDLGFLSGGASVSLLIRRGIAVAAARKIVMSVSTILMLAAALVPFARRPEWAVVLVFLVNTGRASWGANFLAFNQDIAPGRVGMMVGIMGCLGALSGALLVWAIGALSKAAGFTIPFFLLGGLGLLGLVPILPVSWEAAVSKKA
jgi:ACS family hexuronate transporter-like MFS transporter